MNWWNFYHSFMLGALFGLGAFVAVWFVQENGEVTSIKMSFSADDLRPNKVIRNRSTTWSAQKFMTDEQRAREIIELWGLMIGDGDVDMMAEDIQPKEADE